MRVELVSALWRAAGPQLREGPVLDLGCGGGWWLATLAAAGVAPEALHGLDMLPERVATARALVPGAHVDVGDMRRLDHSDRSFAAVTALVALSSLGDRAGVRRALAEAARVVADGGVLVVWEPRVPAPRSARTATVRRRDLTAALGAPEIRSLTVAPPLARRLGRGTATGYRLLAQLPPLRTHRLVVWRRGAGCTAARW